MTPIEKYLAHLDDIFQQEPLFFREDSLTNGLPGVVNIVYQDIPEKGFVTGLTYGLSRVTHPDWKFCRPELCISVNSVETYWAVVAGFLANKLRGECAFTYGQTINFNEKIGPESEMDAFFIFAPSLLEKEDYLNIDIGLDYKICISGLYPMYSKEIETINKIGFEKFWLHEDNDCYSINRKIILQS